ncbi:MAG: ribonucleotide-diphosphate reductase subunit beta, partial [Xanthomonadales bacterium]|nr:ribonucleotide-diphosphate reductase subunit beta [Xanthomonadales bacterium]
MYNWDDPLGLGKKETKEQKQEVKAAEKFESKQQKEKQQPVVNHTPENKETNARVAVEPVHAEDKRVINGQTDINQLAPFKYPWAWKYFLNANKNHWTPLDINMTSDVHDFHHKLNDD